MYRYAIIGFGGLGKLHLSNLTKLSKKRGDFCLCAICGADKESFLKNVQLNIGTVDLSDIDIDDVRFYQDYKKLITVEQPDFIISTLPTFLHAEVAVYALDHGCHVFSEKPMALNLKDCEAMIAASEKNQKHLMIGQCLRFDPAFAKLKEYVEQQTFGRVYRAEFTRYSQTPLWTWNNWIIDPKQSGGCVLDMHIHDVDIINWLFGMPRTVRSAITENKVKKEAIFTQYFYDDCLVLSNADWSLPQSFPFFAKCLVNFENATVELVDGKITVYEDEKSYQPELSKEDSFMCEMNAFLKMVIDKEGCTVTSPQSVRDSILLALKEIQEAEK